MKAFQKCQDNQISSESQESEIIFIQREEGTIYISFCLRLLWYLNSTTF